MYKSIIKKCLNYFGYEVKRIDSVGHREPDDYVLYKYVKEDGSFDYERYRRIQIEGNRAKINQVWVLEENIAFLSDVIKRVVPNPKLGLCHGTRRGKEQEWFRKYLGCEVIGTEISDTATQFPYTIQWDFHNTKPEWINAVDFIYSNSFDHSHNPKVCLNNWMGCVKQEGLCILEHTSLHGPAGADQLDPFGADLVGMPFIVATWSKGAYGVTEILQAPKKRGDVQYQYFIILRRVHLSCCGH